MQPNQSTPFLIRFPFNSGLLFFVEFRQFHGDVDNLYCICLRADADGSPRKLSKPETRTDFLTADIKKDRQ
jgi:hypothetical protein